LHRIILQNDYKKSKHSEFKLWQGNGGSGTHPPAPQPLDWGALGGDVEGVGVRTPHVDAEHVGAVVVAAALVPPGRRLGLLPPGHRRAASPGEMPPHPSPICSHISTVKQRICA